MGLIRVLITILLSGGKLYSGKIRQSKGPEYAAIFKGRKEIADSS